MARKKTRNLSEQDRADWDHVRKSVTPLADPTAEPADTPGPAPRRETPLPDPKPVPDRRPASFTFGTRASEPTRIDWAPTLTDRLSDAPLRMDRKTYQRLKRGKTTPQARIDLHGMTQAQAHPVLTRFVFDAHARGLRVVLVITGKGRVRQDFGPIPERSGVLRHQLPHWVSTGPLRQIVQQVTQAHQRHGGDGAYYLYLRRNA